MMKTIAHRGGSGYFIENSIPAFRHAIEKNCDMAELDVHLTKEKEVIVYHDDRLNHGYTRKKDGTWLFKDEKYTISEMSLSELKEFTIGEVNPDSAYSSKFPEITSVKNEHVPTLREVIQLSKEMSKTFKLVIEIKTNVLSTPAEYWKELIALVFQIAKEEDFIDRTILCGFDWNAMKYAKEKEPSIETWLTLFPFSWYGKGEIPSRDLPPSKTYIQKFRTFHHQKKAHWFRNSDKIELDVNAIILEAKEKGADALFCYYSDGTKETIEKVHSKKLKIIAWSVNLRDEKTVNAVNNSNLDGFCTDYL